MADWWAATLTISSVGTECTLDAADAAMIRGLNHVGISVADLDRSIRFYREAFGLEVIERCAFSGELYAKILALSGARGRVALLSNGNLQLELFEFAAPQRVRRPEERSVAELGIS